MLVDDPTSIYFHGLPGYPGEVTSLEPSFAPVAHARLEWAGADLDLDQIAARISQETQGRHLHLIGFSMGAMAALRIAARLPKQTIRIDLISPAAPLSIGDFLDQMAGKPVFQAAQKSRSALDRIVFLQKLALRLAPNGFLKLLFQGVCEQERALLKQPIVRQTIISGLKYSILDHTARYKSELRSYTSAWCADLRHVDAEVQIWQGEKDSWVPPDMSKALATRLPNCRLHMMNDLGHYGALVAFLGQYAARQHVHIAQ